MTLIPYVGKDDSYELPFSTAFRMGPPKAGISRPSRALSMFRNGKDTMFIAAHFKITEPTALRWISMARSNALNLADPYKAGKA
jgi:hypothetical protein